MQDMFDSEYNNMGELYGFDQLEAATEHMSPVKRAMFIRKLSAPLNQSRRSRGEMEKFFKELPKPVKSELLRGSLRLADYTVYSIKIINSKTIKMFEKQDDKEVGVRNISNAKLSKNMVFLVSGIILLTGTSSDPNDKEANKAIDFSSVSSIPALANGEFSLKANRKQIVPENQSNRGFVTDNDNTMMLGYYKLDNPRLIRDEELIEFTIELGTQFGIPPGQYIYVGLDGTGTTP